MDPSNIGASLYRIDQNISVDHFSYHGAQVQVHTYVLTLFAGGFQKVWCVQRILAYHQTHWPLPSLGWSWVRSRSVVLHPKPLQHIIKRFALLLIGKEFIDLDSLA